MIRGVFLHKDELVSTIITKIPWEANDFGLVRMAQTVGKEGGKRSEVFVGL